MFGIHASLFPFTDNRLSFRFFFFFVRFPLKSPISFLSHNIQANFYTLCITF